MAQFPELCEDWPSGKPLGSELSLTENDPVEKKFRLKYVGVVPAERACSAPAIAAAIENAILQAKAKKKKLQRVFVTVSPKGIIVEDATSSEKILDISIYRISYCSADGAHSNVFAFIVSGTNDTLECHVFSCPKRKHAKAATLAAAQSFNAAYQIWQTNQDKKVHITSEKANKIERKATPKNSLLIDFYTSENPINSPWVSFDENGGCDFWKDAPASHLLMPVN